MRIQFRPHHFLCSIGFEGKGYSQSFVDNFSKLVEALRGEKGGDVEIEVVQDTDSVCEPCPNRRGTLCTTEEKIRTLDRAHLAVHKMQVGSVVTWAEAEKRVAETFTDEAFHSACQSCSWKSLGVCEAALKKLRSKLQVALMVCLLGVGGAQQVYAANSGWIEPPEPTDALEVLDRAKKSQSSANVALKKLSKIWAQLQSGKRAGSESVLKAIGNDPLFSDLEPLLRGDLHALAAEKEVHAKSHAQAIKDADRAVQSYVRIFSEFPDSTRMDDLSIKLARAELLLAEAAFGASNMDVARRMFERAFQRVWRDDFMKTVETHHVEQFAVACDDRSAGFCEAWIRRLMALYPVASQEYQILQQKIPAIGQLTTKARAYDYLFRTYSELPPDELLFKEGFEKLTLKKDEDDAIDLFEKLLKEYPKSSLVLKTQYWLARAHLADKKKKKADAIFEEIFKENPLSYYGLLSAIRLGKRPETQIGVEVPKSTNEDPTLTPPERRTLKRAEGFLRYGLKALARRELESFKPRSPMGEAFLLYVASLADEAEAHLTVFRCIGELFSRGVPWVNSSYVTRMIFPVQIKPLADAEAAEAGISPKLLMSLIKQESAFRPLAQSGSGAMGLTQLMPDTALSLVSGASLKDFFDSQTNIKAGAKYIARLLKRFDGNIAYTLAGYNAGPTRVARWKKNLPKDYGFEEFVEWIPYKETHNYVASIARNYYWYHMLQGEELPLSTEVFWK